MKDKFLLVDGNILNCSNVKYIYKEKVYPYKKDVYNIICIFLDGENIVLYNKVPFEDANKKLSELYFELTGCEVEL